MIGDPTRRLSSGSLCGAKSDVVLFLFDKNTNVDADTGIQGLTLTLTLIVVYLKSQY